MYYINITDLHSKPREEELAHNYSWLILRLFDLIDGSTRPECMPLLQEINLNKQTNKTFSG